ncbi:MAG: hypothetical protein H6Q46_123 [Deltaproteobacteria bacterium]|nr:hypothetical protein [Deltaproteobacteria bacterium]
MMFIEMKVAGITMDPFSNTPIVILKDLQGKTALPIWIGILEASAIATELGDVKPPRPMTHDLLKNILENLNATVTKIEVTDLKDNTFFASICLSLLDKSFSIDARPSDAIALALRTNSPIYVNEKVVENSRAVNLGKEEKLLNEATNEEQKWQEILENLSPDDFGKYKM